MRNVFDGSEIQDVAELTQMLNDVDVCSASWPTWDAKRAMSSLPFLLLLSFGYFPDTIIILFLHYAELWRGK